MTQRITEADMRGALDRLNGQTKRKYRLDGAYGGWRIVVEEKGSSINDIGYRGSKAETYYAIQTVNKVLEAEKREPI